MVIREWRQELPSTWFTGINFGNVFPTRKSKERRREKVQCMLHFPCWCDITHWMKAASCRVYSDSILFEQNTSITPALINFIFLCWLFNVEEMFRHCDGPKDMHCKLSGKMKKLLYNSLIFTQETWMIYWREINKKHEWFIEERLTMCIIGVEYFSGNEFFILENKIYE